MSTRRGMVAVAIAVSLSACVIGKRDLVLPKGDEPAVLLLSTAMPQPISDIARHAWFSVRAEGEERWSRIEVGHFSSHPLGGVEDSVILHKVWRGVKAEKAIKCLREHASEVRPGRRYLPWPGPNSNTFVDVLLRKCNLHADLPATSIGKDYRGLIGVSFTSGGTGIQIETPIVGLKLGLTEGIEIHFFGLVVGIDWWPPAIILPFGGGRLGFADW